MSREAAPSPDSNDEQAATEKTRRKDKIATPELEIRNDQVSILLRIVTPEGVVGRVVPPQKEGAPHRLVPIELTHTISAQTNVDQLAKTLLQGELLPFAKAGNDIQELKPQLVKNTLIPKSNSETEQPYLVRADVYELELDDPDILQALQESSEYVLVSEEVLTGQSADDVDKKPKRRRHKNKDRFSADNLDRFIKRLPGKLKRTAAENSTDSATPRLVQLSVAGKETTIAIPLETQQLVVDELQPTLVASEHDSPARSLKIMEALVWISEKADHAYDKLLIQWPDRLNLEDLADRLPKVINNSELVKSTYESFVMERAFILMVRECISHLLSGGTMETALAADDIIKMIASWVKVLQGGGTSLFQQVVLPQPFSAEFQRTANELMTYDLSESGLIPKGVNQAEWKKQWTEEVVATLGSNLASSLGARWGNTAAVDVVLWANHLEPTAAIITASQLVLVFAERLLRQWNTRLMDVTKEDDKTKKNKAVRSVAMQVARSGVINSADKIAALPLFQPVAALMTQLFTFISLDIEKDGAYSSKNAQKLQEFRALVDWVAHHARELKTEFQYEQYNVQKRELLSAQPRGNLTLPTPFSLLSKSEPVTVRQYAPTSRLRLRRPDTTGENSPDSNQKREQRYSVLDAVLLASDQLPNPASESASERRQRTERHRNETAVFFANISTQLKPDRPDEASRLREASLLLRSGVTELSGINTHILGVMAGKVKDLDGTPGTTYLRTPQGDENIHLDQQTHEKFYLSDVDALDLTCLSTGDVESLRSNITESTLFTPEEKILLVALSLGDLTKMKSEIEGLTLFKPNEKARLLELIEANTLAETKKTSIATKIKQFFAPVGQSETAKKKEKKEIVAEIYGALVEPLQNSLMGRLALVASVTAAGDKPVLFLDNAFYKLSSDKDVQAAADYLSQEAKKQDKIIAFKSDSNPKKVAAYRQRLAENENSENFSVMGDIFVQNMPDGAELITLIDSQQVPELTPKPGAKADEIAKKRTLVKNLADEITQGKAGLETARKTMPDGHQEQVVIRTTRQVRAEVITEHPVTKQKFRLVLTGEHELKDGETVGKAPNLPRPAVPGFEPVEEPSTEGIAIFRGLNREENSRDGLIRIFKHMNLLPKNDTLEPGSELKWEDYFTLDQLQEEVAQANVKTSRTYNDMPSRPHTHTFRNVQLPWSWDDINQPPPISTIHESGKGVSLYDWQAVD